MSEVDLMRPTTWRDQNDAMQGTVAIGLNLVSCGFSPDGYLKDVRIFLADKPALYEGYQEGIRSLLDGFQRQLDSKPPNLRISITVGEYSTNASRVMAGLRNLLGTAPNIGEESIATKNAFLQHPKGDHFGELYELVRVGANSPTITAAHVRELFEDLHPKKFKELVERAGWRQSRPELLADLPKRPAARAVAPKSEPGGRV